MTSNARLLDAVPARSRDILKRCYRREAHAEVVERALVMLATADGHLLPDGTIKGSVGGRPATRRPS
ncbi:MULTISPECIES: hypothetical protein [unclassified Streptomyces]|uniref:hypothetical protein n=1 Tax=unclassified Streptomyces TaxID=2593676 RepID=UPI00278C8DC2|nr:MULTISPECIES: hypothetical protein [unclassified Streptomyces]